MFAEAVRSASGFTFPCIGLRRQRSGEVRTIIGAFVVVNADGWAITSAHFVEDMLEAERQARSASERSDASVCTDHVEIWATPGFGVGHPHPAEATVRPLSDIAAVRFDDFDPGVVREYPVLRDAAAHPIEQGMSVCRLGYPFHNVPAGWSDERHQFEIGTGAFPVPSFALDGIVSRFHRVAAEDGSSGAFIETSSPGLRGQSGGPLLDAEGRVCGIQSHTVHLDLGFDAQYEAGGGVVTERQFLNVGAATHISDVVDLLDSVGARYVIA